jgi:cell wall-associated NlpC family hydrolase
MILKTWTLGAVALGLTAFASADDKVKVVGNLGQTTEPISIYSSPRSTSRLYYRVKPFQYVVIQDYDNPKWVRVLLQNGRFGFAPSQSVAKLPYEVTSAVAKQTPSRDRQVLASRSGSGLANYALNFLGTKYVWGGNDLNEGIDCSGFVKQLVGQVAGVNLPRTAAEQALVGKKIERLENLQPGDRLYFWEDKRGKIGHTGIYMGNGWFVHANAGTKNVSTSYLSQKWLNILVAARR